MKSSIKFSLIAIASACIAVLAYATDDPTITTGIPQTGDTPDKIEKRQAYSLAMTANNLPATTTPNLAALTVTNRTKLKGAFNVPFTSVTCTNGTNYASAFAAVTNNVALKVTGPTGAFVIYW